MCCGLRVAMVVVACLGPLACSRGNPRTARLPTSDVAPTTRPARQQAATEPDRVIDLNDPDGQGKRMAALGARFRAEAATQPSHPVAGTFYEGDGLGTNVRLDLSPSGQYAITWHGCMGLYHHEAGTYTFDNKSVTLSPTDHPDAGLSRHRDLLRVAWGRRSYLVPRAQTRDFLQHINRGEEPRIGLQGTGLIRDEDYRLPAQGDPALPDELKAALRPVFPAAILRVGELRDMPWMKPRMVTGAVTLNVGRRQGVSAGQVFRAPDDRPPFRIRVTKLADDTAEGDYYGPADTTVAAGDPVIGRAWER